MCGAALALLAGGCTTANFFGSNRALIRAEPAYIDFGRDREELTFMVKFRETGNALDWRIMQAPEWVTCAPDHGEGVDIVTVTVDRGRVGTGTTTTTMKLVGSTDYVDIRLSVTR
jgi:hypothetical protein